MVKWTSVDSKKIKRIGYLKSKESLHIEFIECESEKVFLNVPEALHTMFVEAKSPDNFYKQFVDGYFDVVSPGLISLSRKTPRVKNRRNPEDRDRNKK